MRITSVRAEFVRPSPQRPRTISLNHETPAPPAVAVLIVHVETDAGLNGLGLAVSPTTGRTLAALVEDELAPRLIGDDPLNHERVLAKIVGPEWRHGLGAVAKSAIDIALWDLKGKAANLPLYQLFGGARTAAPVVLAEAADAALTAEQAADAVRSKLSPEVLGVRVGVAGPDAVPDARKLEELRETLGESLFFAVTAHQGYDPATALQVGRFLEEEIDADWYEDPVRATDFEAYARLSDQLEVPVAAGSALSFDEMLRLARSSGVAVLRPDVGRCGGLTPVLKLAAVAESLGRTVVPHLLPEVAVHLACGLGVVTAVEWVPWLEPLWQGGPRWVNGRLAPPDVPGLGLQLVNDATKSA